MKKLSRKKIASLVVSASLLTVVITFTVIIYNAWQNPMDAFMKDALSQKDPSAQPSSTQTQKQNSTQVMQENSTQERQGIDQLDEFDNTNVINILLLGIDSNDSRVERNMGWRSDMVMLLTVNAQKNTVALTTIPRDTRTYVYHVDKNGNPSKKGLDKINAAYSYGGGPQEYGAKNAMLAVSDFLSASTGKKIPIQYYVSTDLQNVPQLADTFGGVPIVLDVDFPDLGKKGDMVVLNSSNVNLFLQNRYDVGGDLARARHHEEFLVSLMKEFKAKGGSKYITALIGYALQYAKTNLDFQQIVALGSIMEKSDINGLDYKAIGGDFKYISGISYFLADPEDVKNRMNALMQ